MAFPQRLGHGVVREHQGERLALLNRHSIPVCRLVELSAQQVIPDSSPHRPGRISVLGDECRGAVALSPRAPTLRQAIPSSSNARGQNDTLFPQRLLPPRICRGSRNVSPITKFTVADVWFSSSSNALRSSSSARLYCSVAFNRLPRMMRHPTFSGSWSTARCI